MPKLYMLIGVPASGKSTWVRNNVDPRAVVASSDDYLEAMAAREGKTYNEVFDKYIKAANQHVNTTVDMAMNKGLDIVWDQTNLTKKSRAGKLSRFGDEWEKIAVVFPTPDDDEWKKRLDSRPGKTIPSNILLGMKSSIEMPTKDEGFDEIIVVN